MKKIIIRITLIVIISSIVIPSEVSTLMPSPEMLVNVDNKIIAKTSSEIDIPPKSDYFIKFTSQNLSLERETVVPYSSGLSNKVKAAIAKSPRWIQRDLTRQFHLIDAEAYADLILNTSKKYVDEIAFSIAYSSLGNVPSVEIIKDNVFCLFENDKWIKYADIVDYDAESRDYYSTIQYRVIENGIEKQLEYPPLIYYWYVVHPEVASENAEYFYERFWRDYLFNHNDLGYPLLKEKLLAIDYLWDCESYYQPRDRLWSWSIENHPTAIEAISYWIGKTVPNQAIGDRPGQPNVIAHEHNGWCGELQRIAVAVQRTALIPSVGACNVGEDHVWREFYERGWHQNDNWWADGGGAVDKPDVYGYDWGKHMSAIFAWKGDDTIYELTTRYIHPEDRITTTFAVKDCFLQPVDGARVTVLVKGPRDITGIKNDIWNKIEEIWYKLPQFIKGKILQAIYNNIKARYNEIPDSIDGLITTTWNYTDSNGQCTFELGKYREYLFVIQQGHLQKPWRLAKNNALRSLTPSEDTMFHVFFPKLSRKIQPYTTKAISEGECIFDISFNTKSYQMQNNVRTDDLGVHISEGKLDFFILDEDNFKNYKNGKKFICFNFIEDKNANIRFNATKKDWYIVFRNNAYSTHVVLDFSIQVNMITEINKVQFVSPETNIFEYPVFNIGETVNITGIATSDIILHIENKSVEVLTKNSEWVYKWNTSENTPGDYLITAECGDTQDQLLIKLQDTIPPIIKIENPKEDDIIDENEIIIMGRTWDNLGVKKVEVAIDDYKWQTANGTRQWSLYWNISEYALGNHIIYAKVIDSVGRESLNKITIVINESGNSWGPEINNYYHQPDNPTNTSNIVIYANVTTGSPFPVQKVLLYWSNDTITHKREMFRYGDNPMQDRHEEDSLKNKSNTPLFGLELGQFSTGENISYWIECYDTAKNYELSNKKYLHVY